MKAAVMEAARALLMVREVAEPECPGHGAVVRVEANSVCRSDWHGWIGDWHWLGVKFEFPHVLGHEMCGVIGEVGTQVAVDALGIEATCVNAIRSLRARGRHLQIGLTRGAERGKVALRIDLIVAKELTGVGSYGMQVPRYAAMLAMIETGKLNPRGLVSRTIALEETGEVLASMNDYATLGIPVIDRY